MAKKNEYATLTALRDELNLILGQPETTAAEPDTEEENSATDFSAQSYADLKKLCKKNGLPTTGDKSALIARLTEGTTEEPDDDDDDDDEEEEEAPAKKSRGKSSKKSAPAPKEEEEEEEADDDDEDSDDISAQVIAATEDMSDEDLADFCADNGLSPKGKRQSLIARVVKAVEAGDIELSSDDDDADDEEDEEEAPAPKKSKSDSKKNPEPDEEEDDDDSDDSDDEEGQETEEHATAVKAYDHDTRAQFKKGEIERDDIIEFLADFNDEDKKKYKKMTDGALIDAYIDASSMLINDDGDIVEDGAYTVNGVPYCCGHELSYDEDSGKYICEHCGESYEAEE